MLLTRGAETLPIGWGTCSFLLYLGVTLKLLFVFSFCSIWIYMVCLYPSEAQSFCFFFPDDTWLWRAPLTHTFKAHVLNHLDSSSRQTSLHRSFLFDGNPFNHFYMVWEQSSKKPNFMYLCETFCDFPVIPFPLTPWSWGDSLANCGIFWGCDSFDLWGIRRQTMGRTSKIEILSPSAFYLATNEWPNGI